MSTDEKLVEIANLIENMLKKNGKFITVNYSTVRFDYATEDVVRTYRHKLQCFRHSSEESIKKRASYSQDQKAFWLILGWQ